MHQLALRLRLTRPAVMAAIASNPNLVSSEGYISGSSLWGAAASGFIANPVNGVKPRLAHADDTFRAWFLRDRLRFLNAYPVDQDTGERLLPAPLSLQSQKGNESVVHDLADSSVLGRVMEEHTALEGISGFVRLEGRTAYVAEPARHLHYHEWRPDRMKGRPTETAGALFLYESLEPEQVFSGRILGVEEDLVRFRAAVGWTEPETRIRIGRSRTAQYGGDAVITFDSDRPEPFPGEVARPVHGEVEGATLTPRERLVLTLLSPLIVRDLGGRPAARLPLIDLNRALGGTGLKVEGIERSYTRLIWVGGYASVWNLPRPQCPALAAGSVFVLRLSGVLLQPLPLRQFESHSLGIRTGEGFGRFTVDWHNSARINERKKGHVRREKVVRTEQPPAQFLHIYRESRRRLLESAVRLAGLRRARDFEATLHAISPSQVGRLNHLLHAPDGLDRIVDLLRRARRQAREQLQACRSEGVTLLQTLERLAGDPGSVYRYCGSVPDPGDWPLEQPPDGDPPAAELARLYLQSLCAELARLKRLQALEGEDGTG
jgi:CRISPR-associated protein Csx10